MRNPVANGVALPQLDVTNDAVEAKPQTEEQEILEKFSPSRQHSMRFVFINFQSHEKPYSNSIMLKIFCSLVS